MWCLIPNQNDEEAATRIQAAFRGFKERRERIAAGKPVFLRTTRRMGGAHRMQGGVPQHQGRVSAVVRRVGAAEERGEGGGEKGRRWQAREQRGEGERRKEVVGKVGEELSR